MFSVPDGLAANHPLAVTTFKPPIGSLFAGARVSVAMMRSPAIVLAVTSSGESLCNRAFSSCVAGASIRV
jgi:hypothetical protein